MSEDFKDRETHPSYGLITVTRAACGGKGQRLFMSPLRHDYMIALEIRQASVSRHLNENWPFGEKSVVRVHMTENQFARMLTSSGDGTGTPCTITRLGGTSVEDCPEVRTEDKFYEEVRATALESAALLKTAEARMAELLDKKSLTRADRDELMRLISDARRRLDDHLPFAVQQMHRHMDRVVETARGEVDAYVAHKIHTAGLAALGATAIEDAPRQALPAPATVEE